MTDSEADRAKADVIKRTLVITKMYYDDPINSTTPQINKLELSGEEILTLIVTLDIAMNYLAAEDEANVKRLKEKILKQAEENSEK